jgi:ADP-heptose:LPS heptosyltransferase
VDTCGRLSLFQSAELVRRAQAVITHDTGLMHIAAAFHKRIISVWGNTVPEFGMYPFYPEGMALNATVEVKHLSCRPCSKIGGNHCPKGHFRCMNDISTEAIVGQIQS